MEWYKIEFRFDITTATRINGESVISSLLFDDGERSEMGEGCMTVILDGIGGFEFWNRMFYVFL